MTAPKPPNPASTVTPPARRRHITTVIAVVTIIVLAGALSVILWRVNEDNEQRLLERQLLQARASVGALQGSLETTLAAAAALGSTSADWAEAFGAVGGRLVREGGAFVSVSLWSVAEPEAPVTVVGEPPAILDLDPEERRRFFEGAASSPTMALRSFIGTIPHWWVPR